MNDEYESLNLLKYLKPDIDTNALDCKNPELILLINDILSGIKARDRNVILKRFLIDPPMTLRALGTNLNISYQRVGQLEKRALKRVKYNYTKKGGKEKLEQLSL